MLEPYDAQSTQGQVDHSLFSIKEACTANLQYFFFFAMSDLIL